jgi:hypothetical protein
MQFLVMQFSPTFCHSIPLLSKYSPQRPVPKHPQFIHSKGFWRWCVTLITTRFLDFVHRPDFQKQENTTFRKLDLFPSSGGAPTLQKTKSLPCHKRCQIKRR